ncbi:hypothetical protein [Actinophytocola sp.]|uniref:hypothetical protein n=1 Tax=Actinophytocola sp. TaxID=1872138 RepID=UPI002D7EFB7B|nr:hypothetical protein [Actinophytocola sp.]HET9141790.1 hypothetical protein [Actinophytocola sp.]
MRWVLGAALAGLGVSGWLVIERYSAPEVDAGLARAVLPLIDQELERGPWTGLLTSARPESGPRWFCAQRVVETGRDGAELRVGLLAHCVEYGRADGALIGGSGEQCAKLVVLTGGSGRWTVTRIESSPDGHAAAGWEREHFSPAAVRRLHDWLGASPDLSEDVTAQARLAFGLPPDAPVRSVSRP